MSYVELAAVTEENESKSSSVEYVHSVESYFAKGMMFGTLGEALDAQLVYTYKTSRATQTDWKWRVMAERWRHGRIKEPSKAVLGPIIEKQEAEARQKSRESMPGDPDWAENVRAGGRQRADFKGRKPSALSDRGSISRSSPMVGSRRSGSILKGADTPETEKERRKRMSIAYLESDPRYCRPNDKRMDTSDLEFDPYDPNLRYTPMPKETPP